MLLLDLAGEEADVNRGICYADSISNMCGWGRGCFNGNVGEQSFK